MSTDSTTRQQPASNLPATAGGNHRKQLSHLRLHRSFQAQDQYQQAKISWNTVITKEQSYRHITAHLHHKINTKAPNFYQPGTLNSPEGQNHLEAFARRLQQKHRLSASDGHQINWDLRYRAIRAHYRTYCRTHCRTHCRTDEDQDSFIARMELDYPAVLTPKQHHFPEHIKQERQYRADLKDLLRRQGISPKRHRQYLIVQAYLCRQCLRLNTMTEVREQECPICHTRLTAGSNLTEIAAKPDSPYSEHLLQTASAPYQLNKGYYNPTVKVTLSFNDDETGPIRLTMERFKIINPVNRYLKPASVLGMDVLRRWNMEYNSRDNSLTFDQTD